MLPYNAPQTETERIHREGEAGFYGYIEPAHKVYRFPEPDCSKPTITTTLSTSGYLWRATVRGFLADGPAWQKGVATREEAIELALAKYPQGVVA